MMFKNQISRKMVAVSFTILLLLSGCSADMKGSEPADKSGMESTDTRLFIFPTLPYQLPLSDVPDA